MIRFRLLLLSLILLMSLLAGSSYGEDSAGFSWSRFHYTGESGKTRAREMYVWYPTTEKQESRGGFFIKGSIATDAKVKPGKHPLLLFSHGYRSNGLQVVYLMEALARAGYIVISTSHADSFPRMFYEHNMWLPLMFRENLWDAPGVQSRHEDLLQVWGRAEAMNHDERSLLYRHIDESKVGIIGYSLGAYTALGMLGAKPEWKEQRLQAALLLAPFMPRSKETLSHLDVPTMVQSGSWDIFIKPSVPAIYAALPKPSQWVVLPQANHFTWTNSQAWGEDSLSVTEQGNPKWICAYAVAFFNEALKGKKEPLLRQANGEVSTYVWK